MRIRTALAAALAGAALLTPTAASAAPKPKPATPVGLPRAANWTLTGVVGSVDVAAGTITVTAPGGNARPRVVADLTAVEAGDTVLVKGVRAGSIVTVTRVEATSPLA